MRYVSVCSGIEAASVAWHPLGWECAAVSEIEAFPSAVLAHHYPDVPNLGDLTRYADWPDLGPVDLLVGGTPCQSFSVAGLRQGLADPRGNLALVFLGLLDRLRPRWVVWENVPGVLSSSGGRDFGSFLGGLAELGYGWAYRVLDAQYFGVAQRRRRVFVVGYLGDWRPPVAVLFEPESLRGDTPPRREAGERVAYRTTQGVGIGGGDVSGTLRAKPGSGFRSDGTHVEALAITAPMTVPSLPASTLNAAGQMHVAGPQWPVTVAPTLNAAFAGKQGLEDQHALGGAGLFVPHVLSSGQANASITKDCAGTLDATDDHAIVVVGALTAKGPTAMGAPEVDAGHYITHAIRTAQTSANGHGVAEEVAHTLDQAQGQAIAHTLRGTGHDASEDGLRFRFTCLPCGTRFGVNDYETNWVKCPKCGETSIEGIVDELERAAYPLDLRNAGRDPEDTRQGSGCNTADGDPSPTLTKAFVPGVAATLVSPVQQWNSMQNLPNLVPGVVAPNLTASNDPSRSPQSSEVTQQVAAVYEAAMQVRRLTPTECARLQGFPDDWLDILYRGKPAADGPKYKALGNSMAVPVMSWIGERIAMVDAL